MPGPPPKPNRRRRNAPTSGSFIELPAEPFDGPRPRMPRGLTEPTKAVWRSWFDSPMAHMWLESDWSSLEMMIRLEDRIRRATAKSPPSAALIAELRNWLTAFGLNPKGRQNLRWRIAKPDDHDEETKPASRWGDLRVVDIDRKAR